MFWKSLITIIKMLILGFTTKEYKSSIHAIWLTNIIICLWIIIMNCVYLNMTVKNITYKVTFVQEWNITAFFKVIELVDDANYFVSYGDMKL